ncbi:Beta-galactosidase/beta-glucuronidase [Mucilaginibacter pineti]|uniref:Beta-galactosidase/beta-glucuronidase n=1 Tax=Mucilaginibacter pineti TaxID=1391627 RepID=A0A1G7IRH5_9SPHI|nr:sugar-binding domain-containing protein [Mucilaginibacter pineti]SDF15332.1 Beta-galactosidase/beta-glucuronidase [Mucilaginibacter pineti]
MKNFQYILPGLAALCLNISNGLCQQPYKMQDSPLLTRWAKQITAGHPLNEYPRPQLMRPAWTNLNGLWSYAITDNDQRKAPAQYDGKILVPYPLESALSGIKKTLRPSQLLWYKTTLQKPNLTNGERALLHFGAVDWQATVFVNGKEVGQHTGGYTAFNLDITDALKEVDNELVVKVYDPTNEGIGPHGKQVLNPANIYYTPTSGIWQTVWLEKVPAKYICDIKITPDIDHAQLQFSANISGIDKDLEVEAIAYDKQKVIASWHSRHDGDYSTSLAIPVPHLWSPSDPFLYDLTVRLKLHGKIIDEIKSYFAMRKISIGKDAKGIDRICLNNKPYFNLGTLDQGFWPDGLYTAPTDEALAFDIKAIKSMGFNTIRKHIKVEPARWYYYTDKLGMLVWQDMVNPNQGLPEGSKPEFEKESAEILAQLHNYPSIVTWVLFNEKWGQYDQERLTKWIKETDPSRIVNGHTGELLYVNEQLRSPSPNAYVGADMTDVHAYPDPMISIKQAGKAQVVGEFGGIGVFIPDHQWLTGSAWGYIQEKPAGLMAKYKIMNQHLKLLKEEGLSGSIYTQPFDVEGEQNGLMTYDREVIKVPFAKLRKIHSILNPDVIKTSLVIAKDADITEPGLIYSKLLDQYIAGKREPAFLKRMAMQAVQAGDKPGAEMAGKAYIASLKIPLADDDRASVAQFTKSTKDAGYALMLTDSAGFKQVMGSRKYTLALMNMIYKGELEPVINAGNVDWNALAEKIRPFGEPGDEILMRAKTVEFINKQNWSEYVPAATAYLAKYGKNIAERERKSFQEAIDQHK